MAIVEEMLKVRLVTNMGLEQQPLHTRNQKPKAPRMAKPIVHLLPGAKKQQKQAITHLFYKRARKPLNRRKQYTTQTAVITVFFFFPRTAKKKKKEDKTDALRFGTTITIAV